MPKRYHITEKQVEEIKAAQRKNKNKNVEKRLKVLLLHAQGKKRLEISNKTDFTETYISELVSKYCNQGLGAIVENHYAGNHRNLSFAAEEALLQPFREAAQAGQIVEVSEIKQAYEAKIGRSLDNQHGQIYYVLQRHGWRKVMPRSRHPKQADAEAIDASKKLKKLSKKNW